MNCSICFKPLPDAIDQYGSIKFVVCRDCFHLDSELNIKEYWLEEYNNGSRKIYNSRGFSIELIGPHGWDLPVFGFR